MSKFINARALLLLSSLAVSACVQPTTAKDESGGEDGDNNGGGNGGGGNGGGSGDAATIYDIQMSNFDEGSIVTITDAVVTSNIIEGDYPAFFVQSAEGGPYNGIYIFKYDEVEYSPAIGDIVTITGEYSEFYDNSQLVVKAADDITLTGTGGDLVVTEITEEPDNWEAYESVLVQINEAEIADASMLYEWGAVQLSIGCWIDNVFTNYDAEDGASYESVTGPLTYSFEKYAVLPRSADDLVGYNGTTGGGGSGGGEDEICDDDIDNDGDGYTDCDDWDCDDDTACGGTGGGGGGGEAVAATIGQVQMGEFSEGTQVSLTDVVATTTLTDDGNGFYVQTNGGGAYSGIYVYMFDEAAEVVSGLAPGDVLNITGEYVEFYDLSEIKVTDASMIEVISSGSTTTDAISEMPSDWEAWEGCLVSFTDLEVTSDEDEYGAADTNMGVKLSDDLYVAEVNNGDTFSAAAGVLGYSYESYRLLPRSAADLTE